MQERPIDATFNCQRTVQNDLVTELVLETALPLILTQDANKANEPNYQFVPESADLKVFGDDVTILGKLSCPGCAVQIFSRLLRAKPDGGVPPAISVDGPELPEKLAKPTALPKGESPPDRPTTVKLWKGKKGDDGYNDRVQPWPLEHEKMEPGKAGWSGPDHPGEMNGEPGNRGEKGTAAGVIFLLCGETDFASPLGLSAVGGPGGDGQPGQDGADGGDGGKGFDAKVEVPVLNTYRMSTAGGDGGTGGNGGVGGQGGQGGDGGKIIVHSLSTSPPVTTASDGGKPGSPGAGGKRGEKGFGGNGGDSTWVSVTMGPGREIPRSPRGNDGQAGSPGKTGNDAQPAQSGSASVNPRSKVPKDVLAKLDSVSQLQMLFERARAEYLVTEPVCYELQLQSVVTTNDIVARGRNLVVVAAVNYTWPPASSLHVRVFDSNGTLAVDMPEDALCGEERLDALKQRLTALKLDFAPAIEFSPRGVLLAGGWVKEADPEPVGGWRRRLIETLIDNLDNQDLSDDPAFRGWGRDETIRYLDGFPESILVHRVAVIAFLLRVGAYDSAALRRMTLSQLGAALELEVQKLSGLPSDELSPGGANLIATGVEYSDAFRRDERVSGISPDDKQGILEDIAFLLPDTDCLDWYRLGGRLKWVIGILDEIPDDHPEKPLASRIEQSAWTTLTNYNRGFDYYGKTPRFAPILSLDTYLTALDSSLSALKDIEEKTGLYFEALRDQKDATNDLKAAVNQTDKALAVLRARKSKILEERNDTEQAINQLDGTLKSARENLKAELNGLKGQVKGAFGLSLDTFFNCLFQLAFINVHEPANALDMGKRSGMAGGAGVAEVAEAGMMAGGAGVAQVAQAGMMAASQLGLMIKEAKENVLTKSGERINKDWMLEQIDVVEEDADLKAEFTKRENGMFSTQGSDRLLVELDKFRDLCTQFYGSLDDARKVRGLLDSYVETITQRNQQIDYYNLLVVALLDLSAEVDKLNLQRTGVQGRIATKTQPGLPSMATFVSGLYEQAKAVCLSDFYHAYRAYAFWALENYSGFYDKIGRDPGAINYDQLNIAKSELRNDVLEALGNNYRTPNHFPAREEDEWSIGRVVVLTKKTHRDFFSQLGAFEEADFELEPATRSSVAPKPNFAPTKAAWCGSERPDFPANLPNPFAGMADVRLTKVRAWLVGHGNTLDHKVTLTHLGEEQFRRPDDKPYPHRLEPPEEKDQDKRKPQYILHEEVSIPFNYNAAGLSYDEATHAFSPGKLFGRGVTGAQDGDLGFPGGGVSDLTAAGKYAPIGPFGRWRLAVPRNLNPELKFSDLHAVVIDFHGFHQAYSK